VARESRIKENQSRDINRNLITTNHHHHLTTVPTIIIETRPQRRQVRTSPSTHQLLTTAKNKQMKKPDLQQNKATDPSPTHQLRQHQTGAPTQQTRHQICHHNLHHVTNTSPQLPPPLPEETKPPIPHPNPPHNHN
jgi:hypothetical protein